MSFSMFVALMGGLGMFIFGMKQMSDGLQKAAGNNLKKLLALLTSNRIAGLLVGTGVTAIIQSSSATTVMVVGFVNAGLMTLKQSIGVIMGANIGTTVTAQLIAFKLSHYSYHAIAIGAILYLFSKKEKTKMLGQVLLGFGILFLGLSTMKDTMGPLRDSENFVSVMRRFGHFPILGVILGTAITVMVQSSSASIGILMSLLAVGIIDYQAAVPILLGENIGTTITALLSSVGANRNARRSAIAHMVFNVIGTAVFLLAIYLIPNFTGMLEKLFAGFSLKFGQEINTSRMLANTHSAFNIVNALIWLPFVPFIVKIVNFIIPGKDEEIRRGLKYLDERMLQTPSMIMNQVKFELIRMHEIAREMVVDAKHAFLNKDTALIQAIYKKEDIVNDIEEKLIMFLTNIPHASLPGRDIKRLDKYFAVIDDIESIGDDANDIAELTEYLIENNIKFSEKAVKSLQEIFDYNIELLDVSIEFIRTENIELTDKLIEAEREIDQLQLQYRNEHLQRLNEGICIPGAGILYLEMVEDLEHISDQFADIALGFKEEEK